MIHDIPPEGRALIADAAAQNPTVQAWLAGWFAGKGHPPGQGRLVIDNACIEVAEAPTAVSGNGRAPSVASDA